MESPKKAYIKSFGCQMNVYDAERMHDLLQEEGYTPTDTPDDADLIVLNTCNIREKAVEKVYSDIGRLRVLGNEREKDGKPRALVAVAGCVAQAEGQEIMRRAPTVDFVFGPQSYHRLPDLLQSARKGQRPVEIDFPAEDKFHAIPEPSARTIVERGPSAFLTIQEGCDKFCTFCVVPYTRGAEYSRPLADIVREAKNLVAAGVREITLLGQNVNAYHGEGAGGKTISLATLLAELASLDGVKRLRYTTSHPRDMDDALINAHGDIEALMPYLHLPVQSGSDRILAAMNRKHDAKLYFDIIDKVRAIRPDIAISSDFIVGFPGETDEDFEQTMELVRRVGFSQSFSFKYSPRPGTPAADEAAQIPESVKNERLYALQALLEEQRQAFHESLIGRTMDVLFEKKGRYEGQLNGRSPYLQPVQVEGITENLIGQIHPVTITAKSTNSLFGIL